MNYDQNVPRSAPTDGNGPAPKPWDNPYWIKGAFAGGTRIFGNKVWTVVKVRQNGRIMHWRCSDGRTAICQAAPTHPDYPKDPTSKQLAQDKMQDHYEALQGQEWGYD